MIEPKIGAGMMVAKVNTKAAPANAPAQVGITTALIVVAAAIYFLSIMPAASAIRANDDLQCLALTIYFEARGEPQGGKLAVASVVMNRVADRRYPNQVCDVVRQGGERPRNRCQFSWWCDGRSDFPRNSEAWNQSNALAALVYWGFLRDPTEGALWYHAQYVRPIWRKAFERGPTIGGHIFYRRGARQARKAQARFRKTAAN